MIYRIESGFSLANGLLPAKASAQRYNGEAAAVATAIKGVDAQYE